MKIWITGIGGCLGSNLTSTFASKGYEVGGNDILRKEEAWRLHDIIYSFEYVWCATEDLDKSLLEKYDVVIDCSIGFPDRPFGTMSPIKTFYDNIQPTFFLLEKLRRIERKPHLITPSSFNVFYGLDSPKITEKTPVQPSTLYGYTKASVEMLVKCYGNTFNIPYTILRVGSAYGPKGRCYDKETEILTDEGWKRFSDLKGNELVYTLNPENMEIVLQPIKRIYEYDYEGKMYHIHNSFIDLFVTPDHKMFFSPYYGKPKLAPIEEMLTYSYVTLFNTGKWKGEKKEKIYFKRKIRKCKKCGYMGKHFRAKEPRCTKCRSRKVEVVEEEVSYPMEDFLKFLGFWLGDGSLGKSKSSEIIITQVKEKERKEILEVCKKLFNGSTITVKKYDIIVHNRQVYQWLFNVVGKGKLERRIPYEIKSLSPELLQTLIEWYSKADGTDYGTKFTIYTSNPKMRDDLMEVALKAGFSARYITRPKGSSSHLKDGRKIVSKLDNYQICITKEVGNNLVLETKKIMDEKYDYNGEKTWIRQEEYKGKVYSVEVPEYHVIYVRRNGKPLWSGNSDELPHKIILYALKGKKQFILRSPKAKRLWTYSGDVSSFYLKLIEHLKEVKGETLHLAGNRGDRIVENIELYNIIVSLMNSNMECVEGEYEEGEMVHGKPIDFTIDSSYTRKLLNWSPQYDLGEGIEKTIEWFKECQKKYIYG